MVVEETGFQRACKMRCGRANWWGGRHGTTCARGNPARQPTGTAGAASSPKARVGCESVCEGCLEGVWRVCGGWVNVE